ncbi:MAG: M56 family metallopeptidase, partial [Planctomycetota bacterium]
MNDLFLQFAASNLVLSVVLAVAAYAVQRTGRFPVVAHLLWVLVLVKLVTPPIVTIPVVSLPGLTAAATAPIPTTTGLEAGSADTLIPDASDTLAMLAADGAPTGSFITASSVDRARIGLLALWLLGTVCVLSWSLAHIVRFNRLLGMASEPAPPPLQRAAGEIASRLGLRSTPTICVTSAHISPMVWWIGGPVRILIPAELVRNMQAGDLRWILSHELAHVRRRDHLVRWLEWLACVSFWWNPVAWWARRNLRINEEICCDALVLASFDPQPRTYAHALMAVVEF